MPLSGSPAAGFTDILFHDVIPPFLIFQAAAGAAPAAYPLSIVAFRRLLIKGVDFFADSVIMLVTVHTPARMCPVTRFALTGGRASRNKCYCLQAGGRQGRRKGEEDG